jgi:hypothetical protein
MIAIMKGEWSLERERRADKDEKNPQRTQRFTKFV